MFQCKPICRNYLYTKSYILFIGLKIKQQPTGTVDWRQAFNKFHLFEISGIFTVLYCKTSIIKSQWTKATNILLYFFSKNKIGSLL